MGGTIGSFITAAAMLFAALASAQTNVAQFEGEPEFDNGDALGYFIWKDRDTWKLRWTTFGAEHVFTGRIVVEGGEIESMKRIDVDSESRAIWAGRPARVVRGPRGRVVGGTAGRPPVVATRDEDFIEQETERVIRFRTRTDDDLDGLNFEVDDAATLIRFNLQIGGEPRPQEVEVGEGNFKPNINPVVVRLK